MASSCMELFVNLAIGIGVIKEFHHPSGTDLEANSGTTIGNGHQRRIEVVPFFFLILDIMDFTLDIIFSSQLFIIGQYGYGALMIIMTAISVSIWVWSRTLIHHAINSQFSTSTIRIVLSFSEMAMFFIQDATTIFIFATVPESYDNNTFSAINLVTTMICGASLVFFQVCLACKKQGCQRCRDFFPQLLHFFNFCCNLMFLFLMLALAINVGVEVVETNLSSIYGPICGYWLCAVLINWSTLKEDGNMGEEVLSKLGQTFVCQN